MPALATSLGLPSRTLRAGAVYWTPANLASPPHISIDADNLALLTKDGSNNLTGVTTEFTGLAAGTVTAVTHVVDPVLNNHYAFNVTATNAAQIINFASTAANLLAGKPGCTMVLIGRFNDAAASAVNRAVVNVTTTSATATRSSIATSGTTANCLRYTVRRLDADTANGDDDTFGQRVSTSPFIVVMRQDNTGAVVGGGTPTKQMIIVQAGVRTTISEATGLGSGNFENTNSANVAFFNSSNVAPAKNAMNWGAIDDTVWSDAEVEKVIGWGAWKLGMAASILEAGNPYRNSRP
jgi:hypothetical protein